MRDIVATIQREQDEAIRSPAGGVTLVRGGPGTGKTAVALHRAAFLLYSDRRRFAGGGVLVVGPSPVFVNYIARVLPSLGEDEVTLSSLGTLVLDVRATRHDPDDVATIKGSARMATVLARAVRDSPPDAPTEFRLLYRGQLLRLDRQALRRLRDTINGIGAPHNTVRRKAAGQIIQTLYQQAGELFPGWQTTREEFAEQVAERSEFIAFMRLWWPVLTPVDVLRWLGDAGRLRTYANGLLDRRETEVLAAAASAQTRISVEDVALIDELDELLGMLPKRKRPSNPYASGGVQELATYHERQAAAKPAYERPADYREYAHIVVDEAQDVSPMQWRMIGRRASLASWTIVGDPAQSAWRGDPTETRKARDAALRGRKRNDYVLTTNYRNSVEIFDVAARVVRRAIPDIELPTAVRQTGVEPVHTLVTGAEIAEATRAGVVRLLSDVEGTVGVITTQSTRDEVVKWLASVDDPRLQVVTSLEAKGMEYDGVLIVEPEAIVEESPVGRTDALRRPFPGHPAPDHGLDVGGVAHRVVIAGTWGVRRRGSRP